jgi:hypothetical protein
MSRAALRSFSSGELAPTLYARTDLQRYAQGVKTARNVTVQRTGGLQSRPGTEYLGTTKGNGIARLEAVVFDTDQAFVLEFGNLYVRFWLDGALITRAASGAWSGSSVAYAVNTIVSNGGVNYLCIVAHTSGASTEPGVGASWQTNWYALEDDIYEWPTPWDDEDIWEMQVRGYQLNTVPIVHPDFAPRVLTRTNNATWVLAEIDFEENDTIPVNVAITGGAGTGVGFTVTSLNADGVESPAGPYVRTDLPLNDWATVQSTLTGTPRSLTWDAVTGAVGYNIYIDWAGGGATTSWRAFGTPSTSAAITGGLIFGGVAFVGPPSVFANFGTSGAYPSVVGAYQQRLLLAGSNDEPDVVYASQTANPYNFNTSVPILDADALSWRQVGTRLNRIRHFAEAARVLWQFSDHAEFVIQGAEDSLLVPGAVNPRQFSANGSAIHPPPLSVNDSALYVQARGGIVRDLFPIEASGFGGSDLTLMSAHLVDGYTIEDWCYEQTPNSVIWAVRNDGVLLSLTYVRELGVLGWARHDTDGAFESVACVPEVTRDSVYAVVRRTVNSNTVRYVERFQDRLAETPVCVDAAAAVLTGLNQGNTLTLSNGIVVSGAPSYYVFEASESFAAGLTNGDVINIRYEGETYAFTCRNAGTRVFERDTSLTPDAAALIGACTFPDEVTVAVEDWQTAYNLATGLSHLEGKAVSIYSGGVIASPNNPAYATRTVTSGAIANLTLFGPTVHVGLPFTSDIQTLDIDAQATSVKPGKFLITSVGAWVEETLAFFAGPEAPTTANGLTLPGGGAMQPFQVLDRNENALTTPTTGYRSLNFEGRWGESGSVFIRHVDPSPLTVLALVPTGTFPR